MRIQDLIKVAPGLYKTGKAVHLVGPPGVGKSSVISHDIRRLLGEIYNEEFGFGFMVAPTVDAPDIRGFLVPTKLPDGTPSSFYTRSAFVPDKEYLEAHPRGIFFIDERNSADVLTNKALSGVILDRQFGTTKLPDGWQIWSASNRVADQSGASKMLKMMINRECVLHLQSDAVSFGIWAEAQKMHPMMIAFARSRPGVVFAEEVPKSDEPFCTARSFAAASEYINATDGLNPDGSPNMQIKVDSLQMQVIEGFIGSSAAAELAAHFKLGDMLPTIDEVMNDPAKAKVPDASQLHAAYAAAQLLLHYAKPENINTLWTYAERLPREIQVSVATSLVARGGGVLLNSQKMTDWIRKNQALINVSHGKR